MHTIPRQRGFTLLELLTALSLILILTVATIYYFSSLSQKVNVTTAADELNTSFLYARTEAIKRNTTVYVSFVPGSNWCYGINTGSACTCTTSGSCNLGTVTAPNSTTSTLSTSGLSSNSIYFEGMRGAANAAGAVTFTVYGQSPFITISISRLGNTQFCSTGIAGYPAC